MKTDVSVPTLDFLRLIFPLDPGDDERAGDLVKFHAVDAAHDWPGAVHWLTRAELHSLDGRDIAALGFQTVGKDVYFCPHGYNRSDPRGRVKKEDAVDLIDVAWVELDDGDINPERFSPPPSIVVHTSGDPVKREARYHIYWLLDRPVAKEAVQEINYRLCYGNHLKRDTGGWDLTQLLRVPGSTSYKRAEPFPVTVVFCDPARRYAPGDFSDLPAAPPRLNPASVPPPSEDTLPTRSEVEAKYAFSRELIDLLDRRKEDRSKALWRVYTLCYQMGMPAEWCYAVVRGSANDKFTEFRFNGADDLWRDLKKGYHMAGTPGDQPILRRLRAIRATPTKDLPAAEKRRAIADEVWTDLIAHGRVYFDKERREAYYYDSRRVIPMEHTNRDWKVLLNIRYDINEAEAEFDPVDRQLYAYAYDRGEPISLRTLAYWDRVRHLLYVYNNDGTVYRLDGDRIDAVENGTDGVLFRDGQGDPWLAAPTAQTADGEPPPTLCDDVLGLPNYVDQVRPHSRREAIQILRLWFYSLFFAEHMEARPHLVIWGPADSGKTISLQAIAELLVGNGAKVATIPSDRKEFETVVSNSHHAFFDNVDSPNKWLKDCLAEVATGIQFSRRVLYTNNDLTTYRVQCHIGLTCREQWFARADVATRLVVLETEKRAKKLNPTVLFDRIRLHRGAIWHEILADLNKVVAHLRWHAPSEQTLRMAGFADFVVAACAALGLPADAVLATIHGNQQHTALANTPIWSALDAWLRHKDPVTDQQKNDGQLITTARLYQELRRVAEAQGNVKEWDQAVPNPRSFSNQLRELVPDLETKVEVEFHRKDPCNQYRFALKPDPFAQETTT